MSNSDPLFPDFSEDMYRRANRPRVWLDADNLQEPQEIVREDATPPKVERGTFVWVLRTILGAILAIGYLLFMLIAGVLQDVWHRINSRKGIGY